MNILRNLIVFCFIACTSPVFADDGAQQLETLRAVLDEPDAEITELDVAQLLKGPIRLVNTNSKARWGISYLGTVRRSIDAATDAAAETPEILFYTDANGNTIPLQLVPDVADSDRYAVYADVQNAPPLGTYTLKRKEGKPEPLTSALFVDAEKGEMGNAMLKLKFDKENGGLTSVKVEGFEQDLIDLEKNNPWQSRYVRPGRILADGPLAAALMHECFSDVDAGKQVVTIFADSTKIRFEEVIHRKYPRIINWIDMTVGSPWALPWNIPGGVWRSPGEYSDPAYFVLIAPKHGINWVPGFRRGNVPPGVYSCSERWIWPFAATFDNGIARRFAAQVHRPLLMLPGTDAEEKETLVDLGDTDAVQTDRVRLTEDGKALLVELVNPTETVRECSPLFRKPFADSRIYRSDKDGKRGEEASLPISLPARGRMNFRIE